MLKNNGSLNPHQQFENSLENTVLVVVFAENVALNDALLLLK